MDTLYIVVPCYNEEEALPETARRLKDKIEQLQERISSSSKIVFVNDGSKDNTWPMICKLHEENPIYSGINLSRNCGHQNALLAGLMTVRDECDMAISMDADLQDDIGAVDDMVEKYYAGADIVYGVRSKRDTDTFFKRFTAESFYSLMQALGTAIVHNHADYRLMSRRALNALSEFKEVNLFLRGLVPLLGYRSDCVYYERGRRLAGESKYPLKKMIAFAFEGITSMSAKPLQLIMLLGSVIFGIGVVMLLWGLIRLICGFALSEQFGILVSLWGIGGILILSLGIVGEYIGKIYFETKARPRYIIESVLHKEDTDGK